MKKVFTLLLTLALFTTLSYSQGITGKVIDPDTKETLIGASVVIDGTSTGTVTDLDGAFELQNLEDGTHTVVISYLGYTNKTVEVTVQDGQADLGVLSLENAGVGLSEVNVIASIAVDRRTPVAVSTLKGDRIEALVGNQEYAEVLRYTPSVYVTKGSGGFGDSRINVRGFDQRNTAVMINGIPVNDMENGWVYWSNWAGLSDVTSNLQVQRGLGASKLAVPSVGGSINIITNAADFEKGGKVSVGFGNDGYQKYGVMLSSGLNDKGFAATAQFTHTRGDGYVDGTKFRAYSYFLSLSQQLGDKQSLAFTVLGAPQWHHQRDIDVRFDNVTLNTYQELGTRFNPVWGTLDGEEFTFRRNFYHKPKAFLNHYLNFNEKTNLKTSAYVSLGRGGGTGPRGRLRAPGSIFNSFSGVGQGIHDANGQVRFDDLYAYNQGNAVEDWGTKLTALEGEFQGQNVVSSDGKINDESVGSGFIRRASMNSHNWFGVLSTLTTDLTDNLTLVGGIDGRYYKGIHYRRMENLMGADAYLSQSDDNNPANYISETAPAEFGSFSDNSYVDGNNVLAYHNDGLVSWAGVFAQVEYSLDKLNAFVSVSGSNQGFKRVDYFNYLDSDPEQSSEWQNFLGGNAKIGANYNIDARNNVFVNAGYISKQPIFDNVFLNFRNDINENVENQAIYAVEAGYGFRSKQFKANLNLYNTIWDNRQFGESFDAEALTSGGDTLLVEAAINYSGVKEIHSGAELEFTYSPLRNLSIEAMASVGSWNYANTFSAAIVNTEGDDPLIGDTERTIFADGVKVGDAAQTTLSLRAFYEPIRGLNVYGDVAYFDNLYADFNILEAQFREEGGQVVKIPGYSLVNAGISYRFEFAGMSATARVNVNNVLDTEYVAELDTNISDDPDTAEDEYLNNKGFYGFGRTWNAGLKFTF